MASSSSSTPPASDVPTQQHSPVPGQNLLLSALTKPSQHLRRIEVPAHIIQDSQPLWSSCIVGHFLGDIPYIGKIHKAVNTIWNSISKPIKIDVQILTKNSVLFRIENESIRERVLKRKYWFISDVPLVVQPWNPSTTSNKPDLSQYPLWVDFTAVPDHLFTNKGLKFLADEIGSFQRVHPSTEKCLRLDVARVMVVVDLEKPLQDTLWIGGDTDSFIGVTYLGVPNKCSLCSTWGHEDKACQFKPPIQTQILQKQNSDTHIPNNKESTTKVLQTNNVTVQERRMETESQGDIETATSAAKYSQIEHPLAKLIADLQETKVSEQAETEKEQAAIEKNNDQKEDDDWESPSKTFKQATFREKLTHTTPPNNSGSSFLVLQDKSVEEGEIHEHTDETQDSGNSIDTIGTKPTTNKESIIQTKRNKKGQKTNKDSKHLGYQNNTSKASTRRR